jgi:hypothetical protein
VCARPGPDLERVAARSRVRRSVKGGGARRSSKGVVCSPQVGNILWVTPVAERACSVRVPVHRWKAPRARLTSLFFAEGRARRPSVGSACRRWGLHPARRPSHDERCPSGSDRGSRAPGARKGAMSRRTWSGTLWVPLAPARPLTRETSASAGQLPVPYVARGSGDRRRVLADRRVAEVGEPRSPPGRKVEGRERSTMEGVLARRGLLSLTRRRPGRAR